MRRDLHLLEEQQLLTRTHGGAVASGVLYELPMRYRGGQHHDAKRAIAAARRSTCSRPRSRRSASTAATTTTEVARALASRPGLRVVTNALNIASELAVRSNIELVVCGGSARAESYELVGPLAELTLAHINLDVAIIGVDGVSVDRRLHHPPRGRGADQPRPGPGRRAGRSSWPTRARSAAAASPRSATSTSSPTSSPTPTRDRRGRRRTRARRARRCTSSTCLSSQGQRLEAQPAAAGRAAPPGSNGPCAATIASARSPDALDRQRRGGVRVDHQRVPDAARGAPRRGPHGQVDDRQEVPVQRRALRRQGADRDRAHAVGRRPRHGTSTPAPAGRLSIEAVVGDGHLDRARGCPVTMLWIDLRRVLGRLLLGLDVLARLRPARSSASISATLPALIPT